MNSRLAAVISSVISLADEAVASCIGIARFGCGSHSDDDRERYAVAQQSELHLLADPRKTNGIGELGGGADRAALGRGDNVALAQASLLGRRIRGNFGDERAFVAPRVDGRVEVLQRNADAA